ncbi:MAG: peptidylprolyl isomerase [Anaerolineae bacterium]|nr:peptidylprolyl isomerase [Anaerolineae bacterium]MDW8070498.1 peptidylprolyl isomerase [Anaerolineae bacterium]
MRKQKTRADKSPTKKQIALSGRQRQQQKRVYIGLAALAGLVFLIVLVALYDILIAQPARPVAIVNDVTIRQDQYQTRLRYERFLLDSLERQIDAQLAALDSTNPESDFITQYLEQVRTQLGQQRVTLPRQVIDDMIEEELARQKAKEVGISVSEEEIREAMRARLAQQLGYLTPTEATAIAQTAVAETATAQWFTPTPSPTATATPTNTVRITATPTLTPTEQPTPQPTPTRHIITEEEFSREYTRYVQALSEQARVSETDLRQYIEGQLLVDALRKWFAEQTPKEAEQVHVSHIQAASEEQARLALERLNRGEDFALVAQQVSSNTVTAEKGGDLGWFMKGELALRYNPEIENVAFSLEPGRYYTQPITSTMGWQIIKVNERGIHPLNENQLYAKQAEAYSTWLQEAKKNVQDFWQSSMAPPDPKLQQSR